MTKRLSLFLCAAALTSASHADDFSTRMPEHIGFGSGVALGAAIAGPVGAIVGGTFGALIGQDVIQERTLASTQRARQVAEAERTVAYQARDRALDALRQETASLARSRQDVVSAKQQLVAMQGVLASISVPVFFDVDSATAQARHQQALDALASALAAVEQLQIELVGYADASGTAPYNQELSEARAAGVGSVLVASGLDQDRIVARGVGASAARPFEAVQSAADRRVEIQFRFGQTPSGEDVSESLYSIR